MTLIIFKIGFTAINKTFDNKARIKSKKRLLVAGLLLWHVYIFAIAQTGILESYDLPPRFPILLIIPAIVFTGIFAYKNKNKAWLQNIPACWLLFYQTFRIIIESLFVFTVAAGFLHKNVTIEGYNYDMIFGYSSLLVGWLFIRNYNFSYALTKAWNYLGLVVIAVIIFLFISTTYFPSFYGSDTMLMPIEFTYYPYVLVAGFLMPSAVFMHVLSLVQLNYLNKKVV